MNKTIKFYDQIIGVKNEKNNKWIGVGSTLLAVAVTRRILDATGGIKSLPYISQLIIVLLCPISFFIILKHEKRKVSSINYKIIKLICILMSILSAIMIVIIIIYNNFPNVWTIYRELFIVMIIGVLGIGTLYIVFLTITNIK